MASAISLDFSNRLPPSEKMAQALVLFLLATIPFLFGAVHPIVQGSYTLLILAGLGGWLLYGASELEWKNLFRSRLTVPGILIAYIALQSLPVPLSVLNLFSPSRAARVTMTNTLAHTGLTAVPLSENGAAGLQTAIFLLALLLYYLALTTLLRRNKRIIHRVLLIMACVGIFEGLYGLFQIMNPKLGILWLHTFAGKAATGTIIYKNQYASLLNMCWPLAFAGGLMSLIPLQDRNRRSSQKNRIQYLIQSFSSLHVKVPFFFLSAGITVLAVLFSLSRGGILAMLFLILFLNLFMPLSRKMKFFLTGLLIVFLGGYGSLLGFDGIISRFNAIDDSGMTRFHFYTSSFPLLLDHWLTGIGTGSYKLLSGVYLKEFPESLLIDRVHNDYLEFAIEVGLPMASVCFIWLFTNMFVTGKNLLQKSRAMQEEHRLSLLAGCAAFCSLSGFLIHGLVDFGWRLPANALYAVTLVAIISWALQEQGQPESRKNPVPVVD